MAITVVGSKTFSYTAQNGGDTISLTDLGGSLQQNDVVVIALCSGDLITDETIDMAISGYSSAHTGLYSDDNNDTNLLVQYKRMGATPDTNFTTPVVNDSKWTGVVFAFRGVSLTSVLDVASITNTGTNSDTANPPSITPSVANSLIFAVYAASQNNSTAWTPPVGLTGFIQGASAGGKASRIGAGYHIWTSGAYDPAPVTNGDLNTRDSWAAVSMAFRVQGDIYVGEGAFSGEGTFSGSAKLVNKIQLNLSGVGTINANLTVDSIYNTAHLNGVFTLNANPVVSKSAVSHLTGAATLAASPVVTGSRAFYYYSKDQTGVNTYSVGLVVQKDTVSRAYRNSLLRVSCNGGTQKIADIQFDTSTGEFDTSSNDNWDDAGVFNLENDWLVWGTIITNSNNTNLEVNVQPAGGKNFVLDPNISGTINMREPVVVEGDRYKLGRDILSATFTEYAQELAVLEAAVSTEDARKAEWSATSDRPSNLSSLAGTEDLKNSLIYTEAQGTTPLFFNQKFDLVVPDSNPSRPQGVIVSNASAEFTDNLDYDGGIAGGDLRFAATSASTVYLSLPMWRCNTKATYRARGRVKSASAIGNGFSVAFVELDTEPSSQATHLAPSNTWSGSSRVVANTRARTGSNTTLTGGASIDNAALTTNFEAFDVQLIPTSTAKFMGLRIVRSSGQPSIGIILAELIIEEIMPTSVTQYDYTGELNADQTSTHTAASITGQADWATYTTISTTTMANRTQHLNTSGRVNDVNGYQSNRSYGLRAASTPPTLSDTWVGTNNVTINISASTLVSDAGDVLSLPSGSITSCNSGTKYYIYRNMNNPVSATGTYGASVNLEDALAPTKVYLGYWTTRASSGGSGGGGGGGSPDCVDIEAYVLTDTRVCKSVELKPDENVIILDTKTMDSIKLSRVEENYVGYNDKILLTTESGITLTLSINTPITLKDGDSTMAVHCLNLDVPVLDMGQFRWEKVIAIRSVGYGPVSHIRCGQETFAAGNIKDRYILTHNIYPNKV